LFNETLLESIIDRSRGTLDPDLIEVDKKGTLHLKEDVYDFIIKAAAEVYPIMDLEEFFLKGSSLTFQWRKDVDIDIYMVDTSLTEDLLKEAREKVKKANRVSKVVPGTDHPLEFYLDNTLFQTDKADVMYDLIKNVFTKMPVSVSATLETYWSSFTSEVAELDLQIGELKRDIVDITLLRDYLSDKTMTKFEIEEVLKDIGIKLGEIEKDLQTLIDDYKIIKDKRQQIFSLNLEEIKDFSSKNLMPENVIFKLLQRYYYLQLLRDFKEVLEGLREEENKGLTIEDVDDLLKGLKDSFKEHEENIFKMEE